MGGHDRVYYDVSIFNRESTGTGSVPLKFQETREQAIIKNSGQYDISIVRFQMDTYSLPSFIAEIESFDYGNIDPTKMIENVSFIYRNALGAAVHVTVPINLIWVPSNLHISRPPNLSASNRFADSEGNEYYYGNSFRHYTDLINTALSTATEDLRSKDLTLFSSLISPYFIWNSVTQCAELLAQESFFNQDNSAHIEIFFNRALYAKLTSLPATKNYSESDRVYKILVKSDFSTNNVVLDIEGSDVVFIKVEQEMSTISNWTPVQSIVFTSNTLPIVQTQMSAPITFDSGIIVTNSRQNFQPIVTATGLPELTGMSGISTAGPHLPHTYFDDFQVTYTPKP